MITREQISEARKLLGWSQGTTALLAGVKFSEVECLERDAVTRPEVIKRVQAILETAGIEFTDDGQPGVRLRDVS